MGWLDNFLLGRPGTEFTFDVNPEGMMISEQPVEAVHRNLAGDVKRSILKASAPVIRINSSYILMAQRNQFASLVGIADTFLSFITRDDWKVILERDAPVDVNTVVIQNTSGTRLSAARVTAGAAGTITINGVFVNPDGSGTNYFTGGSYDDIGRTITLGTPLPDAINPVYVTYTYKGWLVYMKNFNHAAKGGWVDRMTYDVELIGA